MGVSATFRFRTENVTRTFDLLESASTARRWKCKRIDDVATVSEGSQMKMRIRGGLDLADKDLPKTAVVTGMVDGDGEAGVITIEARPSAGVDNVGGRLGIQSKWENALTAWTGELASAMNMGAPPASR